MQEATKVVKAQMVKGKGILCRHWAPAQAAGREGELGGFFLALQEAASDLHTIPPAQHRGRTVRACVGFFNLGLNS